jgi:glycyl-tRNA synthetase
MDMEKLVSLCKRRGFLFQSSEIYGGLNGFWDYGPLGVELKRNVKESWWRDMVTGHDDLSTPAGAPGAYEMVGLDSTIIMHPQVWKCSGHYDLFHDFMVDCKGCKRRFRDDHVRVKAVIGRSSGKIIAREMFEPDPLTGMGLSNQKAKSLLHKADKYLQNANETGDQVDLSLAVYKQKLLEQGLQAQKELQPVCPACGGELTEPREFNLMFKTFVGALSGEEGAAFLRPETAQGIFVNYKNVLDSSRVKIPFGIAQVGKSFRNEITPRNFTFRSREFEQMEIEFFCHPKSSPDWYKYWRDRRYQWYLDLGLAGERLRLRDHAQEELSHYSCGTADIEYGFPFLPPGEFGELEGIAHRGDFDLRSHMEGKLVRQGSDLVVEPGEGGKAKYKGSGKDMTYFDEVTREKFIPHVIEPSAGADRATLAFLCEAYHEDTAPDENGKPTERVVLKLHPRLAPFKAAVFPLVKKEGMPEVAASIYRALKADFNVFFDDKGAVGRRYRRQDEAGTPYCITVDGQTLADQTVTIRDRDTLKQDRIPVKEVGDVIKQRLRG